MAWRLARKGHDVTVYAPIRKTTKRLWRGVKWLRYEKATFKEKGIWILYRCPEMIDRVPGAWHLWQDWDYPTMTKERIKGAKHITLCHSHARYMKDRYPGIKPWITSNGIKLELIEEIEKENIKRNPYRVMYASSPDRGLKNALRVIQKAREYEPKIEFHAFYGFNNLDKLIKGNPTSNMAKDKDEIMELLKQENVFFHGRINQKQLMREWFKSGVYIYITEFFETSHISGMEAQACGAIPLFSPIYAQQENIQFGVAVEGKVNDLTIARAAGELVKLVKLKEEQDKIRPEMIEWARERFNWDNFIEQWVAEAEGKKYKREFPSQL